MARKFLTFRIPVLFAIGALLALAPALPAETPSPAATAAFDQYIRSVEARLAQQNRSPGWLPLKGDRQRLRAGEILIDRIIRSPKSDLPGAMLHHWRGTAFAPGATAADFQHLMRNFQKYPQVYAPQVVRSAIYKHDDDHYSVTMRVRQKHVLTVVMDTDYDVQFGHVDSLHGWSASRSTAIREIADPGTPNEPPLPPSDEHGFLWRLNTYWTYAEADGGLYLQIESISLTRSIPFGLGWAVRPFIDSVPRESLEFTLRKTCAALSRQSTPSHGGSR